MEFPHRVKKPWGCEIWFANNPEKNYCGKELVIDQGWQLSFHRHIVKDEVFYVIQGEMVVETSASPDGCERQLVTLQPGGIFHVPTGLWHSMLAITPVRLIEASTFHRDDDVERLELSRYRGV